MLNKVRQALRRWKVYEKATAHVEQHKDKLIPIGENFMAKRASSKTAETPVPGATDKDIQQTEGDSGSEDDPGPSTTGNKRKARKKLSDEQKVQRGNKRRAEGISGAQRPGRSVSIQSLASRLGIAHALSTLRAK